MAGAGCQCCGLKGVAVRSVPCGNPKCVKKGIQVCLGCQAAAVNQRRVPMCKTCQNTCRPKKKKSHGICSGRL